MIRYNYQHLEEKLSYLLSLLTSCFSKTEITEVQDFVDYREYGLALETIVNIIEEENKQISKEMLGLIYELIGIMSLDKDKFAEKL
jgi:hypothetical protein